MNKTSGEEEEASGADQFIARWSAISVTGASELATAQSFVLELCALLGVEWPSHDSDYMFERTITFSHGDGSIRWLRLAFQNSEKLLSNQELPTQVQQALELDLELKKQLQIDSASTFAAAAQTWPATLPELEARFKGRGPWKKGLPRILDTLEALGRARREGDGWRG